MEKLNTFWKIIDSYGIEIPPIQRDYAQGRENPTVKKIRTSFLDSIFNALQIEKPLSLDFVYGKIYGLRNEEEHSRNKQAIQSLLNSVRDYANTIDLNIESIQLTDKIKDQAELVYLIPLDGQQRLTTLFLIHWYIAKRIGENKGIEILKRFRYKTRKSSTACLNLLTDPTVTFKFSKEEVQEDMTKGILYKEIIDLEFFSNAWLNDPTVQAMLNMLQAIHYKAQNICDSELKRYWQLLTDRDVLNFDFLNLQDFNLSDDLYVKMNARGKQLTNFENFKAWLFGIIEEEHLIENGIWENSYKKKFDVEWNDIFWNHKDLDVFNIDDAYFNYFKKLYLVDTVLAAKIEGTSFTTANNTRIVIEELVKNNIDFDFEYFLGRDFKDNIRKYFNILDLYSELSLIEEFKEYYLFWFNHNNPIVWTDLIKNYIVLSFVECNADKIKEENYFRNYYRVLLNLYNNQTFDSAQLYQNALKSIKQINLFLKDNDVNIYDWLESVDSYQNDYIFTKDQLEEEKQKGLLITKDETIGSDNWFSILSLSEEFDYFKGKISFLLKLAGESKDDFITYNSLITSLFKDNTLNNNEHLLQRALLTIGNYFDQPSESRYYLYKNEYSAYRNRRENWLGFLMDKSKEHIILSLINHPSYDDLAVVNSLQLVVNEYIQKNPLEELITNKIEEIEFFKLYIYCSELFDYGESKLVQISNNKYAYQLNKSNTGGYFNDLLLEFIKVIFFKDDDKVLAHKVKGWDNNPTLSFNEEQIRVDVTKNCFLIEEIESGKLLNEFNTIKEVIEYIKTKKP